MSQYNTVHVMYIFGRSRLWWTFAPSELPSFRVTWDHRLTEMGPLTSQAPHTYIQDVISETSQRSVRKVLGDVTNTVSRSSVHVHRILRYDLNLKPFTLSIMQHLKENDIESRLHFAHWVKTNPAFVDLLWFSLASLLPEICHKQEKLSSFG